MTTALHRTIGCETLPCPRCTYDLRAAPALEGTHLIKCPECGHICNCKMLGLSQGPGNLQFLWLCAIVPAIVCAATLVVFPESIMVPVKLGMGCVGYLLLLAMPFAHAFVIECLFRSHNLERPPGALPPVVPAAITLFLDLGALIVPGLSAFMHSMPRC